MPYQLRIRGWISYFIIVLRIELRIIPDGARSHDKLKIIKIKIKIKY